MAPEAVEVRKGAEIALLDDILGFAVVAQNAASHAIETSIVALHNRTHRFGILAACKLDELGLIQVGDDCPGM